MPIQMHASLNLKDFKLIITQYYFEVGKYYFCLCVLCSV